MDLAARHASVAGAVESRVLEVLRSGAYVGGPLVGEAEAIVARWFGCEGAVGVASGTDALMLGLQALGIGPGHEVIVPALSFFATAGAVAAVGAVPVVADVGEDALLDPEAARSMVSGRTRAVLPVHLFGNLARDPRLGVPVLDDAAQAVGTQPPAAIGHATAVSAYPTKTWGAAGDAGFVLSDDHELLERVRSLGNHGRIAGRFEAPGRMPGRASRLDALQAAVLLAHAPTLTDRVARRRAIAERYDDALPPTVRPLPRQAGSAVHQYCVLVEDRARVRAALHAHRIGHAVYYAHTLDQEPALAGCPAGPTPVGRHLAERLLALPVRASLTDDEVGRVIRVLQGVAA